MSNVSFESVISNSSNSLNQSSNEKEVLKGDISVQPSTNTRKKRKVDSNRSLCDILSSDSRDVFDQQSRIEISRVVGSVNCLSNANTGGCLLIERFGNKHGNDSCICPSWLKKVLKCFSFLNIFYAFFHAQCKPLTWAIIEEALKHSSDFGLDDVFVSDVESLSILCPKSVVILGKQHTMERPGSAITIGDSSFEAAVPCELQKKHRIARKCTSTLVNAIEKRGSAFRTDLWRLIVSWMETRQLKNSLPLMWSLDDLLTVAKDCFRISEQNKVKSHKPRVFASKCHGLNHLEPSELVDHLREAMGMDGQIVHVEFINAKEAVYVELPDYLSDNCRTALEKLGISRLYSHQAESICASISGKNVVVATSTSSGKSLCYNIPILEELSKNLSSCALYIFPTKALAQDQLRALLNMTTSFDVDLSLGVYDGDTSQEDRIWIRDNARLLITNPDMLHTSILPYHKKFERILSNLRCIVIDEAHVFKGAFGCHTALVLRRLRRICSHVYGSDPSFIFCTATSANPREHAMELANLETLELVQNDGSPSGQKYFLLWNPPLRSAPKFPSKNEQNFTKKDLCTRRSSPILEVSHLFAEVIRHGLRCIAFCKTRKLCELVMSYTRELLQESSLHLVDSICVYRGGYTSEDRRSIESRFFGGTLLGVAATNALELGIDVGHIDATLHLGFPGSVASLWQQAGRSGRRSKPSLAIYVAFDGPLDQYFMKHPHKLFMRPIEHCQVDGQNQKVLEQHIACAAVELPLCTQYDEKYFGAVLQSAITDLKSKGYLSSDQNETSSIKMWNYIGPENKPSMAVSLRAIETEKFKVIDLLSKEVLEEIEESKAFFQVYEGAVYMHQGFTYLVKTLNLSEKTAYCQKADLKYYTKTRDYTDIHVFGSKLAYPPVKGSKFEYSRTTAQVHSCNVTTTWFGFHRIWKSSNQIYDTVDLYLPVFSYESQAAWIRVPQSVREAVELEGLSFRAGKHAASHALLNVVPLYMMCNSSDLSTECANPHETRSIPERLLLYDKHPGGIGITTQIQLLFRELLTAAFELVSTCSCLSAAGCPNCVQAFSCSEYNEILDKKAAVIILKGVIESEEAYFKSRREFPE
ncbi:uncharacterized protein LOC109851548 [Asparagus officinalis]|uniref:uncharacterized protein LOC109851548 n=1 Tax=Asparagus officinalis TaxID=4686 RepID=UPI00098E6355|nr:uncharacterized protein LOC109851548 [Asparagus officinalis]